MFIPNSPRPPRGIASTVFEFKVRLYLSFHTLAEVYHFSTFEGMFLAASIQRAALDRHVAQNENFVLVLLW